VGFEPTTTVFERAKTVHALDRSSDDFITVKKLIDFQYKMMDENYHTGDLVEHTGLFSRKVVR
jgi:hypothetical protein